MTPRRLAALRALAERGATEGERVAARNALDAHQREQAEQRRVYEAEQHAAQARTAESGPSSRRSRVTFSEALFDLLHGPRVRTDAPPTRGPIRGAKVSQIFVDDVIEVSEAQTDPSDGRSVRIEVATEDEMRRRFRNDHGPHLVTWNGSTYTTPHYNGFTIEDSRYFLIVAVSSLLTQHA